MARRAAFLSSAKSRPEHRLLLGGGDYFASGGLPDKLNGEVVLKSLRVMGYDALALGSEDFAYGTDELLKALQGLPVVSTNMFWTGTKERIGKPMIVTEFTGLPAQNQPKTRFHVAVLAFMDEKMQAPLDVRLLADPRHVRVESAVESAREWVPRAREAAELVVALVGFDSRGAAEFAAQVPGIDVLIACRSYEVKIDPPGVQDAAVIVANGDRGRFVGELRFDFSRLASPVGRSVLLDRSIPEDPGMKEMVEKMEAENDAKIQEASGPPAPAPPRPASGKAGNP